MEQDSIRFLLSYKLFLFCLWSYFCELCLLGHCMVLWRYHLLGMEPILCQLVVSGCFLCLCSLRCCCSFRYWILCSSLGCWTLVARGVDSFGSFDLAWKFYILSWFCPFGCWVRRWALVFDLDPQTEHWLMTWVAHYPISIGPCSRSHQRGNWW